MRNAVELRMQVEEFRLLRDLIGEYCGLSFGPEARHTLERRLRERVTALGLDSFGEYYQLMRFREGGRSELEEAVDLCTINETYFFREEYQLRALREEVLPELSATRKKLSIWSAGCATGDEVYSIGITVRESGRFQKAQVRVFGSDISRRCLTAARLGRYSESAFRTTSPRTRAAYFSEGPGGWQIRDDIKSTCHFGHLNLIETSRAAMVGRVDVIFCRNVLIYFDDASRRKVIDMFYDRLLPGGYLFLGHSESLLNVSTAFELVQLREDLAYRKPATASRFDASAPTAMVSIPPSKRRW